MKEQLLIDVNKRLKEIKTFKELKELINYVECDLANKGVYASFIMKKSDYEALDFSQVLNPDKVNYIIDDGVSFRSSMIENLYKNIIIKE